jgi:hypothetical protein
MATKRKSAPSSPTVAAQYLEFLAAEGYRPRYDDDMEDEHYKVIVFKMEGEMFLLFAYEDDPDFFCVGHAYSAQGGEVTLAKRAQHVNDTVKGVKCQVVAEDHQARFSVETFLGGAKPTGALLRRSIDALRYAARVFFERQEPEDAAN